MMITIPVEKETTTITILAVINTDNHVDIAIVQAAALMIINAIQLESQLKSQFLNLHLLNQKAK